jgi:hypothetical protein
MWCQADVNLDSVTREVAVPTLFVRPRIGTPSPVVLESEIDVSDGKDRRNAFQGSHRLRVRVPLCGRVNRHLTLIQVAGVKRADRAAPLQAWPTIYR